MNLQLKILRHPLKKTNSQRVRIFKRRAKRKAKKRRSNKSRTWRRLRKNRNKAQMKETRIMNKLKKRIMKVVMMSASIWTRFFRKNKKIKRENSSKRQNAKQWSICKRIKWRGRGSHSFDSTSDL